MGLHGQVDEQLLDRRSRFVRAQFSSPLRVQSH
jgi:hypothetical protein